MASIQQTPNGPVIVLKESALQDKGRDAQKNNIMAVGLIKTKWVHSSKNSPSKNGESPLRAWWNKTRLANEKRIEEANRLYKLID